MLRYLFSLAFLALPSLSHAQDAHTWKAGVAKVKITPERLMWMSGYGARDKPAEGKLTDLWAKALALEDAKGKRGLLITMDLVGIDRVLSQRVCEELKKKHGLPRERIILSVSHTHCGPVVRSNLITMYDLDETQQKYVAEYADKLKEKLLQVADEALKSMQPAELYASTARATFAVNRRNNKEAEVPRLRAEDKLTGPEDHDVPVLAVRGKDKKLIGVVFGYACHATVLSFYQWCADYPGFAQTELEKAFPGAVAMFWAGCGADQNPLPRRTVELAKEYGAQLADAVEDELRPPHLAPLAADLNATYMEIDLPFGPLPTREQLADDLRSTNKNLARRAKALLARLDKDGDLPGTYPYPIQLWRLGRRLDWVTLGGEVVVDYALRLKQDLGPHDLWVMAYANDVMAYIPSRRVLKEGGYEGATSMVIYGMPTVWSPRIEEEIVGAVRFAVRNVRPAPAIEHGRDVDPLRYVHLMATVIGAKSRDAYLRDWLKAPTADTPHIVAERGSARDGFRIVGEDKRVLLRGRALRVDHGEMFFTKDDQVFHIRVGENLREALEKPLSDEEISKRGLRESETAALYKPPPGKYAIAMHAAPWSWVFQWLENTSEKRVSSEYKPPTGTYSLKPAFDGKIPRTYAMPEIAELLNRALEDEHYVLVAREGSFACLPREHLMPVLRQGKLLKVEANAIYFEVGGQAYQMRMGQSFGEAMSRPLAAHEVKNLGLKISPRP